jgi:hypothetical protein
MEVPEALMSVQHACRCHFSTPVGVHLTRRPRWSFCGLCAKTGIAPSAGRSIRATGPGGGPSVSTTVHNTQTGSIIFEHDTGGDRSETVAALKSAACGPHAWCKAASR